ncbi:serine hydrolase domain-containing protein [Vibrio ulleungensis]|uniref:Serine hydrolase n=1 Tax=Vibrio ulleungensis TaxID=2807619 RepID=A0ABS2HEP1_9VIBR|nr:serine hydrolase domain-containing protein [Vibrio ulleungensis]MBM7036050.1 serine hydrolase [Vibrio ulleungensis]
MNIKTILAVAISSSMAFSSVGFTEDTVSDASQYPDSSYSDNLSGWKAMITNANPVETLESGRWFDAAPVPRPFKEGKNVPFSDEIKAQLQANTTDAVLVVKDGAITGEYFRYGFDIDDIHLVHSAGKAFTSFAIQPIYDDIGDEGLNRKLSEYLPKLKGKYFGEATLAQALDMQVGMEWSENYEDPTTATMLSGPVGGWDPLVEEYGPESWYERMFDFPKYDDHGKTWIYSSASVISASFAAEAIAGKHYSDLVQASYNRLGFEDASWYVTNQFNELSAEGGQALTIRDAAKIGRYMLETKDSTYVSDVWNMNGDINNPADALHMKKYPFSKGYKNYWYKLSDDVILALGSSGQFIYVDKAKNLVIVKFSSFVKGQSPEEFTDGFEVLHNIAEQY